MAIWSLLFTLFAFVQSVGEVRDPRPGWVTDQANVIDPADEAALATALATLHDTRGYAVAVVTVDDVPGSPKAFATSLFNTWQLGDATRNDGVLVLLVVGQRRLEIETGDGMQVALTAAWLAELQRTAMVPRFKQGQLGAGLRAGTDAIVARLTALPGEQDAPDAPGTYRSDGTVVVADQPVGPRTDGERRAPPSTPASTTTPPQPASNRKAAIGLAILSVVIALPILLVVLLLRRRNRCTCGVRMIPLDEVADDAYLSPGQRAEEQAGSVNYTILLCPSCRALRTRSRRRLFSSRTPCTGCGNRTAITNAVTLREATYARSGVAEITVTCSFCPHRAVSDRHIPRLVRTTSSSSSRTSSFSSSRSSSSSSRSSSSSSSSRSSSSSSSSRGGGRSSGGGAGSGW